MDAKKAYTALAAAAAVALAACTTDGRAQGALHAPPVAAPAQALGKDPRNAAYRIEGNAVILVDGSAAEGTAPGSASALVTRYFGNALDIDLNADGAMDSAFLLTQERGGSGVFFYAAAAIRTEGGFLGTNALFLGDRIAPQNTAPDPDNPGCFIVSYATRMAGEPMSAQPSRGASKRFGLKDGTLVEIGTPAPIQ